MSLLRSTLILGTLLLLCTACPDPGPERPSFGEELPSIVAPVPDAPLVADEGKPGAWEALPGLEKPARAFIVAPEGETRGGLVLGHTRWGANAAARDLARDFAKRGFLVVLPDFYEGVVPSFGGSVEALSKGVGQERAAALTAASLDRLGEVPVRHALGVAYGGHWVLPGVAGRKDVSTLVLDSTRVVYGPDVLAELHAKVLLLHGEHDAGFATDFVGGMDADFEDAGTRYEREIIEDAGTSLLDREARGHSMMAEDEAMKRIEALWS